MTASSSTASDGALRVEFFDGSTPSVIRLLEDLLAQAREGNVPAIAVATGHPDGRAGSAWIVGRGGSLTVMLGEVAFLQHEIAEAMRLANERDGERV